jgi:hypothetical protein
MKRRGWILLILFFAVIGFSGMAEAGLVKIGTATYNGKDYNLIYEDDQGLIWLDYTNPSSRPALCWDNQVKWAAGLNDPGVLTYKFNTGISVTWEGDWRLPKAVDGPRYYGYDGTTTAGYNITTSEMGHLFYVSLGNVGYYDTDGNPRPGWGGPRDQQDWGLKNSGAFENLRESTPYWTGTEFSAYPVHAWDFYMYLGSQDGTVPMKDTYPWLGIAVRPAKVISSTGK